MQLFSKMILLYSRKYHEIRKNIEHQKPWFPLSLSISPSFYRHNKKLTNNYQLNKEFSIKNRLTIKKYSSSSKCNVRKVNHLQVKNKKFNRMIDSINQIRHYYHIILFSIHLSYHLLRIQSIEIKLINYKIMKAHYHQLVRNSPLITGSYQPEVLCLLPIFFKEAFRPVSLDYLIHYQIWRILVNKVLWKIFHHTLGFRQFSRLVNNW